MKRAFPFRRAAALAGALLLIQPVAAGPAQAAGPGGAMAWGWDYYGGLGDGGTNLDKPAPVAVSGLQQGSLTAVAAGDGHSLALRGDGGVLAWGNDSAGQLGDGGADANQTTPVAVNGLGAGSGVVALAAGATHSLALRSDGSVLAWGDDSFGQLGNGGVNANQSTPVGVSGLGAGSGVVAVAAGYNHSLAVRANGSVVAWGADSNGQLGDGGANADQPAPVGVSGLGAGSGVLRLAAGYSHSLAVRVDGSVLAWGSDSSGQLGDAGANAGQPAPVGVSGLGAGSGVVAVAAGAFHSLALRANGAVMSWGDDSFGELGDAGTNTSRSSPVAVSGLAAGSGAVAVEAGAFHSLALRANGAVSSWGLDSTGQLGDGGTNLNRSVPVAVSGLGAGSRVVAVAGGGSTSLAAVGARRASTDFDGNGASDRSVYSNGAWHVQDQAAVYLGVAGDIPVPADYDGNGSTDRAVYRDGAWYVHNQATVYFGLPGDIPVPGDYDGNGDAERAVYRPSVGGWYVEGLPAVFMGQPSDIPVPGDYDGNGTTDRAVFRDGAWYVEGQAPAFVGLAGYVPVPGDYDGNGSTDRAVYKDGGWFVHNQVTVFFGLAGYLPVPGDYDGDGDTDRAVFKDGAWYVEGQATAFVGLPGDIPLPLPQAIYRRFF